MATCAFDSTSLRILDQRKGDEHGPLLVCPACDRRFVLGSMGPEEAPAEA